MEMPEDQFALYAEFGIAAEKAQVLETEAGNVVLHYLSLFLNTDQITPEETEMFRSLVEQVNRKPLGHLLKKIWVLAHFDASIIDVVDEGLKRRNYLTHHFFRSHNFALFSEDGRKVMVADLKQIQVTLDKAHSMLQAITSILIKMAGREEISEEQALRFQSRGKPVTI